jgi:hypothetical protein
VEDGGDGGGGGDGVGGGGGIGVLVYVRRDVAGVMSVAAAELKIAFGRCWKGRRRRQQGNARRR